MADIQEIMAWKAKADSDFTAARDLLKIKSSSTDAICFHCQQAVEKYLKAMLIFHGMEFPRTHDLSVLAEMLSAKQREIVEFREKFSMLTSYAVDVRYPDDEPIPGSNEAKQAFKCAKTIKNIFNKTIKAKKDI